MPTERTYYCFCDDNCKFETLNKEQIIATITEATGVTPTGIDEAFITMLQEQNASQSMKIWVGTEAQYNAISEKASDTLYFLKGSNGTLVYQPQEGISYETLEDKPSINGVELSGDVASSQLGLSYNDLSNQPSIPVIRSGSTDPTGGNNGDIYIKY